jgi:membrane fusion protein, type I secretion system
VLRRLDIRAPITGTVVNLRFFTLDGVIEPGAAILDLVPEGDRLVIETHVSPLDIDVVEAGLPAQVCASRRSSSVGRRPCTDG